MKISETDDFVIGFACDILKLNPEIKGLKRELEDRGIDEEIILNATEITPVEKVELLKFLKVEKDD